MKVSIITPLFNRSKTIGRCIESCLAQTILIEHIVMDAASTDGSVQVVEKYLKDSRIKFESRADRGIYDGMNRGLSLATGDYVMFLGADDYLAGPRVLEALLFKERNAIGADLVLASVQYEGGKTVRSKFGPNLIFRNSIHHQGCLYKGSLFSRRQFEIQFRVYGDYDFNLHLLKNVHPNAVSASGVMSYCGLRGISDVPKLKNYFEEIRIRHRYYSPLVALPFDCLSIARFAYKKLKALLKT
jgi:glycosyltransferase involved in cell wall biosynthesis